MNKAIFPGSFDPFTIGHAAIIKAAAPLFDEIIIAVGNNSEKKYLFDLEKRISIISAFAATNKKIQIQSYSGLTIDFCNKNNCKYIIRGLRNTIDFEYEKAIQEANTSMNRSIQTLYFIPDANKNFISSSIVRDIYKNGGDIAKYINFN